MYIGNGALGGILQFCLPRGPYPPALFAKSVRRTHLTSLAHSILLSFLFLSHSPFLFLIYFLDHSTLLILNSSWFKVGWEGRVSKEWRMRNVSLAIRAAEILEKKAQRSQSVLHPIFFGKKWNIEM